MDELEGQVNYLKSYVQRQENLLLDNIRKTIDFEIKILSLNSSLQEMNLKYEESQKQTEIQNEMMQQAANGVESLTLQLKQSQENELSLSQKIEQLKEQNSVCRNEKYTVAQELQEAKLTIETMKQGDNLDKERLKELREEYNRQTAELSELYKENEELKSKSPINKKIKKETATLPDNEF